MDFFAGTNGVGLLFSVDPTTGVRTVLSDFGNPQQGPLGTLGAADVGIGTDGDILVTDRLRGGGLNPGALFRVNPVNGSRTLLSNFGNPAQGPAAGAPDGVVLGPDGNLLVVTANGGMANRGALFRVNPVTGFRTLVSDFGNATQGPLGLQPIAVAVISSDEGLVLDIDGITPGGSAANGLLFRVNLATGARTILSDFSQIAQGPRAADPSDVEVEANGSLLVVESTLGITVNQGLLFRVDPVSGVRTVLSDFGNAAQGPLGRHPFGVAVEPSGSVLVVDNVAGTNNRGTLFRVDPTTGMRTVLSDFGLPGSGPIGAEPVGVTMYPENALLSFCGDLVLDAGEQCDDGNAVSGDGCSATCGLEGAGAVERRLCYATRPQKNSLVRFDVARGVVLADRLETLTVDVRGTESLCNPADVDGSGIGDPAAHLRTYTITPVPRSPRLTPRTGVGVVTDLGAITVHVLRRDDLMVPTAKSLTGPVGPPDSNARERHKCYGVTPDGRFSARDVLVSDQFGQPKTYDVVRPTRLCLPVSKDGDDIENPQADLMCFAVRPARGQPRHVPVVSINTTDEFWSERLQSIRETELCLPADVTGLP
jgi:cysteine-rich repeat protein/uncharacterized repeat protein (TIGR03803 family)